MLTGRGAIQRHLLACLVLPLMLGGSPLSSPTPIVAQVNTKKPEAAGAPPAARELYRQHCAKCHGEDGKGGPARSSQPTIPDFTDTAWQARRSDAQLLAAILDGKGDEMPSF